MLVVRAVAVNDSSGWDQLESGLVEDSDLDPVAKGKERSA